MKHRQQPFVFSWLFLCAVAFLLVGAVPLFAQSTTGTTGTTGTSSTTRSTTGTSSTTTSGTATTSNAPTPGAPALQDLTSNRPGGGVFVNANGVMSRFGAMDFGAVTERQRRVAITSYRLPGSVSAKTPMRCISLNRLEKAIIEADGVIADEMLYLAGIYRIEYVFFFPESKDIVIAGPAEGWFPGYENMMVGVTSSQPVLDLRHLVSALRAFAPGGEGGTIVGCSIDPTQEGSIRLQQFQQQFGSVSRGMTQEFIRGVRDNIGMQTVRVDGIPATTHAAQMMVAADYRMKRIALGEDAVPVRTLQTFINNTVQNGSHAVFRWYFTPDYDSVILTEDRTGMQLDSNGVKLVGENELLAETGERSTVSGELDPGSKAFTQSFTRLYPQISQRALVFAQLRNWIDMLICAAHIQREEFYAKSGWAMEFFGNEEKFQLETLPAPKEIEPIVGARIVGNNRTLLTPVGGVVIDAEFALDEDRVRADAGNKIAERQKRLALELPEGVWWWDVR